MSFNCTKPHHCPKCSEDPEFITERRQALASESPALRRARTERLLDSVTLGLISGNYSGSGGDIAGCPRCKRVFSISYSVVDVTEVPWEGGYVGK